MRGRCRGFGLVYLEAGSFGKPVIASDTGGVPDAVLDGVTGIVIPQESPERCARALKKFSPTPFWRTAWEVLRDRALSASFLGIFRQRNLNTVSMIDPGDSGSTLGDVNCTLSFVSVKGR